VAAFSHMRLLCEIALAARCKRDRLPLPPSHAEGIVVNRLGTGSGVFLVYLGCSSGRPLPCCVLRLRNDRIGGNTLRDPVVLLMGARGAAGQMHARIYRSLPVRLIEVDLGDPLPRDMPWSDVVIDVCTPTTVHGETLAWGYAQGVRR